MSKSLTVYEVGSNVTIGDDVEINATILMVQLGPDGVKYLVVYWDGKTRKTETLFESEVRPVDEKKVTRIGFRPHP